MAAAAPFESAPHLAVALSGGADSTALALIAARWAQARGGTITAVTVDHGLRAGSAAEARAVARWCADRGLAHVSLRWEGPKPARAIQEKARIARHALIETWCREAGILHLLLGHHADDQRETIAMRAAKGSGPEGLAGMAAIAERAHLRLLRPLLAVDRDALRNWLVRQGESWIEDPSNRDLRFLRSRLRAGPLPATIPAGASSANRGAAETWRASWMGAYAAVHPEGWVCFEHAAFASLPADAGAGLLRAGVMTVSGSLHPPRRPALAAAADWALRQRDRGSRSFHGCLLAIANGRLAILRDPAACRAMPLAGGEVLFDRRFRIRCGEAAAVTGMRVIPLRLAGCAAISVTRAPTVLAAASLPAAQRLDGSVDALHVLYRRGSSVLVSVASMDVSFRPVRPLAGAAFAGPGTAELSSTPESLARAERSEPRLPERVVPP